MPPNYDRGPQKVWVYGALRVRDGQALTQVARSRHTSSLIRDWLADHPRIQHAFIPVGAAWLNLIEGWWRRFRRKAFAGASLANAEDIAYATHIAITQLNRHAQPWI